MGHSQASTPSTSPASGKGLVRVRQILRRRPVALEAARALRHPSPLGWGRLTDSCSSARPPSTPAGRPVSRNSSLPAPPWSSGLSSSRGGGAGLMVGAVAPAPCARSASLAVANPCAFPSRAVRSAGP